MINNLYQREVAQEDYEAALEHSLLGLQIPSLSWTAQALLANLRLERNCSWDSRFSTTGKTSRRQGYDKAWRGPGDHS